MGSDSAVAYEGVKVGARYDFWDKAFEHAVWTCEKWSEEACDYARKKLGLGKLIPISSAQLLKVVGVPEEILVVEGNLLLNEGIQRFEDLLIGAGGVTFANANAFIGVGDTLTAEAATQTELQAAAAATNRFYKAMNATFPSRATQTITWQSDFTSAEANFHWQEWTVAAGATSASGSGFLVGTTNLNRKVSDLGTKATGTWTLGAAITFS